MDVKHSKISAYPFRQMNDAGFISVVPREIEAEQSHCTRGEASQSHGYSAEVL